MSSERSWTTAAAILNSWQHDTAECIRKTELTDAQRSMLQNRIADTLDCGLDAALAAAETAVKGGG